MIIDDNDFYQKQSVFSLTQQRAVATSLNALVFRTYCPSTAGTVAAFMLYLPFLLVGSGVFCNTSDRMTLRYFMTSCAYPSSFSRYDAAHNMYCLSRYNCQDDDVAWQDLALPSLSMQAYYARSGHPCGELSSARATLHGMLATRQAPHATPHAT